MTLKYNQYSQRRLSENELQLRHSVSSWTLNTFKQSTNEKVTISFVYNPFPTMLVK